MGDFQRKYSNAWREAFASAVLDRGMTPKRVVELAAAGDFTANDGSRLEHRVVPPSTVKSIADRERRARMGRTKDPIADAQPRDAIEQLRVEYVTLCRTVLKAEQSKATKDAGTVDLSRLHQIGGIIAKAAAIPGRNEARGATASARTNPTPTPGRSGTDLGAGILADAGRNTAQQETAPELPEETEAHTDSTTPQRSEDGTPAAQHANTQNHSEPGSLASVA